MLSISPSGPLPSLFKLGLKLLNYGQKWPRPWVDFSKQISYTSAHVLLNLLNEMSKSDKMRALSIILSLIRIGFDNFNNAGAQMLDSIFHRTLKLPRNHILSRKREYCSVSCATL